MDRHLPKQWLSLIDFERAVMAAQHFLDGGHSHIGHISDSRTWWQTEERRRGKRETLDAAMHNTSEPCCTEGDWSSTAGEQACIRLLDSFPEIDAIFVANDRAALSVLWTAFQPGIHIPEQPARIGFANSPESVYFHPSLTTISQDFELLGEQDVEYIVGMIHARQQNQGYQAKPCCTRQFKTRLITFLPCLFYAILVKTARNNKEVDRCRKNKSRPREVPVDGHHHVSASGQEICPSKEGTFMNLIRECQNLYCTITIISIRREE